MHRIAVVLSALLLSPVAVAAPRLLPEQIKRRYLSQKFTVDAEEVKFTLKTLQYKNLSRDKTRLAKEMAVKGKLLTLTNQALKKEKAEIEALVAPMKIRNNDPLFMHVFSGKGAPEQITAVLKLATKFRSKLGASWKDKGSLGESAKQFYWDFIGLDCSGFAGNYAKAVGSKQGPNSAILSFAPPAKRITKVADIKPGSLLVWKDNSHIATINGKRKDGRWDIVESNGDPVVKGLGNTVWEFKDSGKEIRAEKIVKGKKTGASKVFLARVN